MARTRMVKRWRRNMEVRDDAEYVDTLTTLSEGSVRRNFNPYTDIDWDSPEFAVIDNDERWILPSTDPLGGHRWYKAQPVERQIEIGKWRQANVAKVGLQFEIILIRGLTNYAFWVPNGSPEYRYCLHESVEECNHTMMFQEMVNRIGADVPGMPRLLRWISPFIPLVAGPLPIPFFFGVLAGEEPIDHTQKNVLREGKELHPIMERVMAIHVAEEARHISFAHEYLRKRLTHLPRRKRFWLSIYVPLVMRVLCQAIVVPPQVLLAGVRHPAVGEQGIVLPIARVPAMAARHVRRRADALPRHGPDEPGGKDRLADLQDRRTAEPLPQRTRSPARGRRRLTLDVARCHM